MELISSFDKITSYCFELFKDKNRDYGPTWLLYRLSSLNDEIWRKAKRIRTLEEHEDRASIAEGRDVEYIGIINYSIMFLIRLNAENIPSSDALVEDLSAMSAVSCETIYDNYRSNINAVRELLIKKNNDYGNAWQSMSINSITDQIIIRTYRIRNILSNGGQCTVSEGLSAQLQDIINYCVFALIKMDPELKNL